MISTSEHKADLSGIDVIVGVGRSHADFSAKFLILGIPASDICCVRVFRGGRLPSGHFELVSTHGHGLFDTLGKMVLMAEGPEDIIGIMTRHKLADARDEHMRLLKDKELLRCNNQDGRFPAIDFSGKTVALVTRRSHFLHPDLVLAAVRQILVKRGALEVRICEV